MGKIGFIHPSPYPQGGWPASRPAFGLLPCTCPKRQHNHFATLISLSSLSYKDPAVLERQFAAWRKAGLK